MAKEIKLTKKLESFKDEETGEIKEYYQLYLYVDGVKTKIKPCYKTDKKYLVAVADEAK